MSEARALRDAFGRFATGVTVVTTQTAEGPLGITANSFSSVSLDPPLVLWSPGKASRRFQPFADADTFAIHVLAEEQAPLCNDFARDGWDFAPHDWQPAPDGTPLLNGCLARFHCATQAIHDAGDHVIIVGVVLDATERAGAPLIFSAGQYGRFTSGE